MLEPGLAPARIPVVDLGEAMDPRSPHAAEVAHDLGQALDRCGALYLVGHGVSDDLVVGQLELARLLFAREAGGWRRVRRDDGAACDPPDRFDLLSSQALLVGERDGLALAEQVPEALAASTTAYMLALARVSQRLLQLLALSLDRPPQALLPPHGRVWQTLRLLRYPPAEGVAAGARAHVDHGALTLLAQDHHLGLELQEEGGRWAPVLPRAGALLVHAGEALQQASGGRYRALVHRVRRSALQREERVSVACFYTPLPR